MTASEQSEISRSLSEWEQGDIEWVTDPTAAIGEHLAPVSEPLADFGVPVETERPPLTETSRTIQVGVPEPIPLPSEIGIDEEPWVLGVTPSFRKSVARIDKKLLGRVLEALLRLVSNPRKQQGDTIKPLEGDQKGLWRYRIGDFRLIYQPVQANRQVVLLYFGPRGDVYQHRNPET
jgi:mRNA-degrading endonuclease RelE of RelBE toxin-antitoxin system